MILLGYSCQYEHSDVYDFLRQYGMVIYDDEDRVIESFRYIGIESETLSETGLCCWGRYNEVNMEKLDTLLYGSGNFDYLLENAESVKKRMLEDASWWISFVKDFLEKFKTIVLYRYYDDMDLDNGVIEIGKSDLTIDVLLHMKPNQKIVIS
jgi:hypothetical protein